MKKYVNDCMEQCGALVGSKFFEGVSKSCHNVTFFCFYYLIFFFNVKTHIYIY
jgi:hypothetical protein